MLVISTHTIDVENSILKKIFSHLWYCIQTLTETLSLICYKMPDSITNGCLIMGGVAVAVAVCLGIYYYETQWVPYRNPPAVIKKISAMFEKISPGSGKIPIKEGNESYTMN